jgi:hypothetical protein
MKTAISEHSTRHRDWLLHIQFRSPESRLAISRRGRSGLSAIVSVMSPSINLARPCVSPLDSSRIVTARTVHFCVGCGLSQISFPEVKHCTTRDADSLVVVCEREGLATRVPGLEITLFNVHHVAEVCGWLISVFV